MNVHDLFEICSYPSLLIKSIYEVQWKLCSVLLSSPGIDQIMAFVFRVIIVDKCDICEKREKKVTINFVEIWRCTIFF